MANCGAFFFALKFRTVLFFCTLFERLLGKKEKKITEKLHRCFGSDQNKKAALAKYGSHFFCIEILNWSFVLSYFEMSFLFEAEKKK